MAFSRDAAALVVEHPSVSIAHQVQSPHARSMRSKPDADRSTPSETDRARLQSSRSF